MKTKTTIGSWGNSAGVRIPKEFMDALRFSINDEVEMTVMDGGILIKPEPKKSFADVIKPCLTLPADWKFDREEANER